MSRSNKLITVPDLDSSRGRGQVADGGFIFRDLPDSFICLIHLRCTGMQGSALQAQDSKGRRRVRKLLENETAEFHSDKNPFYSIFSYSHVKERSKYRVTHEKYYWRGSQGLKAQDSKCRRREVPIFRK